MIEDLRFVEREISAPAPEYGEDVSRIKIARILQAYDGHQWFDVPLVPSIEAGA